MISALASRLGPRRWQRMRLLAMLAPFWLALCVGALARLWLPLFVGAIGCASIVVVQFVAGRAATRNHIWEGTDDA